MAWTFSRYSFPDLGNSGPRSQVASWQRGRSVIAGTPESGKLQAFTFDPATGARTTGTAVAYIDTPGDWSLSTSSLNFVRWVHPSVVAVSASLDDGYGTTHVLRSYLVGSDLSLTLADEFTSYDDGSGSGSGGFLQLFRGYYFQDGSGLIAGSTPAKDGDYLTVGTDGAFSAPTIITTGSSTSSPWPCLRSGPASVMGVGAGVTFTTTNPVVGDTRTWDDIATVDQFEMAPHEMMSEPFSDGRVMFLRWDYSTNTYYVVTAQDTGTTYEIVDSFSDDSTVYGAASGTGNVTSDDKAVVTFGPASIVYDLFGATPEVVALPTPDAGMRENGLSSFGAGTFGVLYTATSAPTAPQIAYFYQGSAGRAPWLRQFPRSPLRHWPPERSYQRSNRRAGGYL